MTVSEKERKRLTQNAEVLRDSMRSGFLDLHLFPATKKWMDYWKENPQQQELMRKWRMRYLQLFPYGTSALTFQFDAVLQRVRRFFPRHHGKMLWSEAMQMEREIASQDLGLLPKRITRPEGWKIFWPCYLCGKESKWQFFAENQLSLLSGHVCEDHKGITKLRIVNFLGGDPTSEHDCDSVADNDVFWILDDSDVDPAFYAQYLIQKGGE